MYFDHYSTVYGNARNLFKKKKILDIVKYM